MQWGTKKSFPLPRTWVLKNSGEIRNVLKNGKKLSSTSVDIYVLNNKKKKFAVLVGAKLGKAVERTRMKRLVREIFRLNPDWFQNSQVVFLLRKKNLEYQSLYKEIEQIMVSQ
jgi:ribonuclease P protein component